MLIKTILEGIDKRGLDSALEYYKNQIKIFKTKSFDSIREAQSYAIEQDLTILGRKFRSGL